MTKRWLAAVVIALLGCRGEEPRTAARPAPVHVDSIFPVEEEIRRFKAARAIAGPTEYRDAAPSRDSLVARFVAALRTRDTASLRRLTLDDAEFIDLYYPASIHARPPYRQGPGITWLLAQENSRKGKARALERYGGEPSGYRGYDCDDTPRVESANRIWERCVLRWSVTDGEPPRPIRLFGSIIERGGRWKFLSYANDL